MTAKKCEKIPKAEFVPPFPLAPINLCEFRKQCLDAHNKYRSLHCCPPLQMCPKMNEFATQWAINLSRIGKVQSRCYYTYGENLFLGEHINVPGDLPVKRWYDEIQNYEFAVPKNSPETSHFTQVIWKHTREIGVGVVRDGQKTYVVVNYSPPGNLEGRFKEMKIVRVIQGPPPVLGKINVEDFRKECLDAHNSYRSAHGCGPLKINSELNKLATKWAENLAKRNKIEHQQNNPYGENLYMAENVEVPGTLPVKRWYDEIEQYNFETAKFSPNVGHFTQVIWKDTTDVGIGVVRQGNSTYVVAEYNPPGNIQGQFKDMVPRKK